MKKIEIEVKSTMVAQFFPGKLNAVMDSDGTMYLPAVTIPVTPCSGSCDCEAEVEDEDAAEERAPEKEVKKEAPKVEKVDVQTYSEDDLMEMKAKDLEDILRKTYKIEPNDFDGKNTNKKLRELILKAQGGVETPVEAEDEEEETPSGTVPLEKKIALVIEDFDNGVSKKKTVAALAELIDKDEDDIIEILEEFEDGADAEDAMSVDEVVEKLLGKKKAKKSAETPKETFVEVSDLKKGDKVSIWWNDDNQDWFNGVVSGVTRKGKVLVDYEDESSEEIDPEIHTKIKLIN